MQSPLLANICLHEVDREWQAGAPRAVLVRYADDMLILCPTRQDARRWPDRTFHETYGLLTVTEHLQRRRTNACL